MRNKSFIYDILEFLNPHLFILIFLFDMSKARSYKNEPFISFEKQSYSVMKDDFVHEKLLTVKTNIQSTNGGVNLKESLSQKGEALTSTG